MKGREVKSVLPKYSIGKKAKKKDMMNGREVSKRCLLDFANLSSCQFLRLPLLLPLHSPLPCSCIPQSTHPCLSFQNLRHLFLSLLRPRPPRPFVQAFYQLPALLCVSDGALRATAEMAVLEQCRVIHGHALVCGFAENVVVGSALVDGYGKAGFVTDARKVFDSLLPELNVMGWNVMMAAYSQKADKDSVVDLWNAMQAKGLVPDEYSFLAMLTALANAGLFFECETWLGKMWMDYGLEPSLEHYTCLVHAMARMGHLDEVERIAMTMPTEPDAAVWRALLSACANHGTPEIALVMAKRLLELDQHDQSAYVIAANVLSNKGRWNEVAELRKLMKYRRVKRVGGMSWMEVKGKVHAFLAGDRRHERTEEIYGMLDELMEEIEKVGYGLVLDEILH